MWSLVFLFFSDVARVYGCTTQFCMHTTQCTTTQCTPPAWNAVPRSATSLARALLHHPQPLSRSCCTSAADPTRSNNTLCIPVCASPRRSPPVPLPPSACHRHTCGHRGAAIACKSHPLAPHGRACSSTSSERQVWRRSAPALVRHTITFAQQHRTCLQRAGRAGARPVPNRTAHTHTRGARPVPCIVPPAPAALLHSGPVRKMYQGEGH